MNKKVTVITCTLNEEKNITSAIEAIQNQTYANIEHIIIDDGSIDKTIDIIKYFTKKYKNIIFTQTPQKKTGAAMARNFALKNVDSDYIAILDADDKCDKKRIEVQVNFLNKNEQISILGSNCYVDNKFKKTLLKLPETNEEIINNIFKLNPFVLSSVMFRTKAWKELKGFKKTEYGNSDSDLWFRAFQRDIKMHNLQMPLVTYFAKAYLPYKHIHYAFKIKFFYAMRLKKYYLILYLSILFLYTNLRNILLKIKYK